MFLKVTTLDAPELPTSGQTEYVKYGLGEGSDFQGIRYTDFLASSSDAEEALFNLIPAKYRHHFRISLMSINRDILPHTDSNTKTAINWYLLAGNYKTSFCTPVVGANSFKLPTQTDGIVYDFSSVTMGETFEAVDGDVYVLDVTKLHCVYKDGEASPRVALNLATNLPYQDVVELLRG